jgi:prepilin-type N-terminal cleavage/methylation domain-containing protein
MGNATSIPEMARRRALDPRAGFTLIELLVVIAIIAIVAGLVVGLAGIASERKRISRAQAERDKLVTLIENYRVRLGVLPPDNTNAPGRNSLYYELASALRTTTAPGSPGNPNYLTPHSVNTRSNELYAAFGVGGVINARDPNTDITELKPILKNLKRDQTNSLAPGTVSLVVPIEGPDGRDVPNPWKYLAGENAIHNKGSFDLWVEIIAGKKTNTIGNWKE